VSAIGSQPALTTVEPIQTPSTIYLVAKRAADFTLAACASIILAPLAGIIALAVKLDSPGPVIFRQRRPGFRGRPFQILKFRTMSQDAEDRLAEVLPFNQEADHSLIRVPEDPRVTRVGRILRRTSLDELPQLINIVRREMSFVGPRPISRPIRDPRGRARLEAMPGLTGLWQTSGRKETSCCFMLEQDMQYLARRSLWLDLFILLRTMPAVLKRRGAK